MKKIFALKFFAAASFGLALSLAALCAEARAQSAPPAAQGSTPQPPQARAGNLMRLLNLTPEQRRRLREIRAQAEPETRELARRVRLSRRALDEAVYADAADEALVEQRARELAAAQAALVRLRASTELKVRGVLTPEQLRAFRTLRQQAQRRQALRRRRLRAAGAPNTPGRNQTEDAAPSVTPPARRRRQQQ
ncbi:MAG TPA: Spy/CpxP family protein refolding chaperone [Pyrinomonadaceae bacterium]